MSRPALHTVEALTKIIDSQCGNASWTLAAARGGVSVPTLNRWRDLSANGDPAFIIEWCGVAAQFASQLARARLVFMSQVEAAALNRAHRGTREKVFYQGKPSWRLDHRYETFSDDDLQTLGLSHEDRYEHDEITGERVQHFVEHDPPVELVKTVLAAYGRRYQSTQHLDVNQTVALGVTMVGNRPKPVQLEHKPVAERVGIPTEIPGVFEEVREAAEPKISNDLLDTKVPSELNQRTHDAPTRSESAIQSASHPVRGNPAINHDPDNPVRKALLAEMEIRDRRIAQERAAGLRPAHALPTPTPPQAGPDDDIDDTTGERVAAPAPPTMDAVGLELHNIKDKLRKNLPLSALHRQVAAALARGDDAGARTLLGYRAPTDREGIGAGTPGARGASLTGGATRGQPTKVV
jgi:hypothetical protein